MITATKLMLLVITDDEKFFLKCENELWNRFQIESKRFCEADLKDSLRKNRPFLIVWDGRTPSPKWGHTVSWLRDHFPGRPIIAIVSGEENRMRMELQRMGILIQLDAESSSFFKQLQIHIFAMVLDFENDRNHILETISH